MAGKTEKEEAVMTAGGDGTWMKIGVPHSTHVHVMSSSWAAMQEELGEDHKLTWHVADVQRGKFPRRHSRRGVRRDIFVFVSPRVGYSDRSLAFRERN